MYRQNGAEVIYPIGDTHMPAGPSMFSGQIIVSSEYFSEKAESSADPDQLRCVIAHEFVHVLSLLQLLVPGFKNWPLCWEKLLGAGSHCENAQRHYNFQNWILDDYGSEKELLMVANYWPSLAEQWFNALRKRK